MGLEEYKQFRQSKIQLSTRLKLTNIFSGEWESIYKGEGIEFADIQPYEPGDDLRDLDLITLIESGEEQVILRSVGRQMKMYALVDMSGSMRRFKHMFFSSKPDIRDVAIGLIGFSACNVYSPIGLCAFDNDIRCFLPAKFGEDSCIKIIENVLDEDYKGSPTEADIPKVFSYILEKANKQNMIFFISDFKDPVFEGDFSDLLRPIAKKFDFIPIVVRDPIEKDVVLKGSVNITVSDSEGQKSTEIYLTPDRLKEMQKASARHLEHLDWHFKEVGIEHIVLDSPSIDDCYRVLSSFFEGRKRIRV
ncbi:MAG: hypothetical protein JW737_01505 [Acidobacteria bacterium]|nr:hypothetical protein [Acidobacteriota bacterium]